jgi:hypothetical protein
VSFLGLVKLKIPQSGGGSLHSGRRLWYYIIDRKLGTSACGLLSMTSAHYDVECTDSASCNDPNY